MSRLLRALFAFALLCLSGYAVAEPAKPLRRSGICLTPWECVQWCYERGCLTTTGCDPSTDGCFCANCS
jgi:hypothetical protein